MKHIPTVVITATTPKDRKGNVKIEVASSWSGPRNDVGTFYLPFTEDWNKPGYDRGALYKSRIKHDFKVTFDHYTCTYM